MNEIKLYGIRVGDKFSQNWVKDIELANMEVQSTKDYTEALVNDKKSIIEFLMERPKKTFKEVSVFEFNEEQIKRIFKTNKQSNLKNIKGHE